jgi:hypothetical protein
MSTKVCFGAKLYSNARARSFWGPGLIWLTALNEKYLRQDIFLKKQNSQYFVV